MNALPVPLPPEHIPAGTRPWQSADARQWAAAVPGRHTHPLWACLALLAATIWAIVADDTVVCTTAAPCGPEWWGTTLAGLALLELYWVWRQPGLALLVIGPLSAMVLLSSEALGTAPGVARLGVLAAVGFTAVTLLERLSARHRQRVLAERAAGPVRHPLPARAMRFRRGRASLTLAVPLLAVAAYAAWQGVDGVARDEERAARADLVRAEVIQRGEESVTVALPGAKELKLEAHYPEHHPVGGETAVLVGKDADDGWARLVSEPYDASGWQLVLLAAALPGLALVGNGIDGRRRHARLRAGPVPALSVLVREEKDGADTLVYAADDLAGERPILRFYSSEQYENEDGDEDGDEHDGADGGDRGQAPEDQDAAQQALGEAMASIAAVFRDTEEEPPLREAVLYGAPHAGGEVISVAVDDDEVVVECSVAPVRTEGTGLLPSPTGTKRGTGDSGLRPPEETAVLMTPTDRPRRWSAGPAGRTGGALMLAVEVGVIWGLLSRSDGFGLSWFVLLAFLPSAVSAIGTALNWRITADRSGLWIAGAWRVRQVTWDEFEGIDRSEDAIFVRGRAPGDGDSGVRIALRHAGWPWLERKLGAEAVSVRAVEEIRALHRYPGLRPTEDSVPGEHGMPLGPVAVVASVVWAAVVLLLS
ncbi:hypothetical protein U9R90_18495 [Streptomyces sp. E11-3]|uniref:hypothetical protein n=1 Tax=Streptomyces sp. E11-3 TaxID=3110112 RepID=UPI0039805C82